MNTQRFFEAMAFKLSLDQKKLDDEFERVVNSNKPLEQILSDGEFVLEKMFKLEGVVNKFNEVVKITNNANNNIDGGQEQQPSDNEKQG